MRVRMSIAAVGAVALLSGTGALLLPAAASAHSETHTLKFTAVQTKSANFSRTTSGSAETDLNSSGKIIGFDVIQVVFNPVTHTASGGVTLDTLGGFLYGTLKFSSGPVTRGKVTGGTGIFQDATGTIIGTSISKTRTAVTITYST